MRAGVNTVANGSLQTRQIELTVVSKGSYRDREDASVWSLGHGTTVNLTDCAGDTRVPP